MLSVTQSVVQKDVRPHFAECIATSNVICNANSRSHNVRLHCGDLIVITFDVISNANSRSQTVRHHFEDITAKSSNDIVIANRSQDVRPPLEELNATLS